MRWRCENVAALAFQDIIYNIIIKMSKTLIAEKKYFFEFYLHIWKLFRTFAVGNQTTKKLYG